jgi:hypothetical protein
MAPLRRADSRGLIIPCYIQRRRYHPSSSLASTQPLLSHRIILNEMGSSSLEVIPFTSSPNPTLLQSWPLVGQQGWDQKPARDVSGGQPTVAGILYRSKQGRSWTSSLPLRAEQRLHAESPSGVRSRRKLSSVQLSGPGMVAFVVDGSDKLLKCFLIHNPSLHQHETKLYYFH